MEDHRPVGVRTAQGLIAGTSRDRATGIRIRALRSRGAARPELDGGLRKPPMRTFPTGGLVRKGENAQGWRPGLGENRMLLQKAQVSARPTAFSRPPGRRANARLGDRRIGHLRGAASAPLTEHIASGGGRGTAGLLLALVRSPVEFVPPNSAFEDAVGVHHGPPLDALTAAVANNEEEVESHGHYLLELYGCPQGCR